VGELPRDLDKVQGGDRKSNLRAGGQSKVGGKRLLKRRADPTRDPPAVHRAPSSLSPRRFGLRKRTRAIHPSIGTAWPSAKIRAADNGGGRKSSCVNILARTVNANAMRSNHIGGSLSNSL
jgi:hypothetical protein